MVGLRTAYVVGANVPFTSSVALLTVGLKSPIAAKQRQKIRAFIPITVGATGGVRAQIVVPAAGTNFIAGILLVNTVAPAIVSASQAASAAFTNALANAGTHWLQIDAEIENGVNAGTIDIQLAQNTSDSLTLTVLKGGFMEVVSF